MELTEYDDPPPTLNDSDDEEIHEKERFNIEEAIVSFVDEDRIRHSEIPEFEPYLEQNREEWRRESEREQMPREIGNLFLGQKFFNSFAFKECVLDYVLKTGYNIKQYRYDKTKIGFSCEGKSCDWRVYCSLCGSNDQWEIRVFNDVHSCVPNGECKMMKGPMIARLFMDKLRDEPDYYFAKKIEELIMEKWKICVTRLQCQGARRKALMMIQREYDAQFKRLRDFADEIRELNPGSNVDIITVQNEDDVDVFNRFYVCFDCFRRTWKETCRPLIGVDGCFLRGKMKGQLLVALGRDGNNCIYPIAWGVVQVENKENWLWFMQMLKADLGLEDGDNFILISDRQKGLIAAAELELPKIEHRMCVRHIYANLKARHGGKKKLKLLLWVLAWSYNEPEYNEALDKIFNYDTVVHKDILIAKPRKWCRAFYKIGNHCEDVENNSTESFNKSIVKARELPLVPMLETITTLAMVRVAKRAIQAQSHKGVCTPYAQNTLASLHDKAADCQVHRSTDMLFQVIYKGCSYRVNLDKRSCTCTRWDISGIPCLHGYGAIMKMKLEVTDYVSKWFQTDLWRRTYSEGLIPMRGARFWHRGEGADIHQPPAPPQSGRKKEKRKKGVNESPSKKGKGKQKSGTNDDNTNVVTRRVMHCGICGDPGHNCRWHKRERQVESSQGVLTQSSQPN